MRRLRRQDKFFAQTRILVSIHHLAYQGLFDLRDLWWLGFGDERDLFISNNAASALKAGVMAADAISTVSPRYAREIQTAEQGYGLDWLMRTRSDRLAGIANGVDYGLSASVWSRDFDTAVGISRRLRAGTVWTNTFMDGAAELPFGGFRQSGIGRELGRSAVADYTEEKTLHLHCGPRTAWWLPR